MTIKGKKKQQQQRWDHQNKERKVQHLKNKSYTHSYQPMQMFTSPSFEE